MLFWNNTFVKTQGRAGNAGGDRGWYFSQSAQMNDWEYRNNLFIWEGNNNDIMRFDEGSSGWTPWTCTNNGWGRNGQEIRYASSGNPRGSVADVNAGLSPIHDNDVEISGQSAVFTTPVNFGPNYLTRIDTNYSLELRSGSEAIGVGLNIPNISDGTDIGARQFGSTPPVVGNRFQP